MEVKVSTYGDDLRRCRESAGMSRERLADELTRSSSTVRSWEVGNSIPPAGVRLRIAAILDAPELVEVAS